MQHPNRRKILKKLITSLFLACSALVDVSADQLICNDYMFTLNGQTYAKIYVDASQVHISKNQILVQIGKDSIEPQTIFSDGKGVFFILPATEVWQCPCCEMAINFINNTNCSNCGSTR